MGNFFNTSPLLPDGKLAPKPCHIHSHSMTLPHDLDVPVVCKLNNYFNWRIVQSNVPHTAMLQIVMLIDKCRRVFKEADGNSFIITLVQLLLGGKVQGFLNELGSSHSL